MRVVLILVFCFVACSFLLSLTNAAESERHQKNSFKLLERVQRQRIKDKLKLEREKQMILDHANHRVHHKHKASTTHSLETLSHGSEYVSSRAKREKQLSSAKKISSELHRHRQKLLLSDSAELSNLNKLLSELNKHSNNKKKTHQLTDKQQHNIIRKEQRKAERRLHQLEKQERERKEELLESAKLGGTQTVQLKETQNVSDGLSLFLETRADPAWAEKPVWWKVPPSEVGNAGSAPWPNDPLYQNGYPATMIDPNNYPLSNVDDPNNYPAIDDPNGAFAPIQQPH